MLGASTARAAVTDAHPLLGRPPRTDGAAPKVLTVSYHAFSDSRSGAALSLRELLEMLSEGGWSCSALCGPRFDHAAGRPRDPTEALLERGLQADVQRSDGHCLWRYEDRGVPVTAYVPFVLDLGGATPSADIDRFCRLMRATIAERRPDVIVAYGGKEIGRAILEVASEENIPVVFWLRNNQYSKRDLFDSVSGVLLGGPFIQDHYRRTLGIESTAIASPVRWQNVLADDGARTSLTFVNPTLEKGVLFAARIFEQVKLRRPTIPLLVVEGRGSASSLFSSSSVDLDKSQVEVMGHTPDPRTFYARTRVLLAPSLTDETFFRVGVEGMINGIPTVTTGRGGITATLGDSGFVFDVDEKYTAVSKHVPTPAEVAPWVEAIVRLWDDEAFYEAERERALRARHRFAWDTVSSQYLDYFARFA